MEVCNWLLYSYDKKFFIKVFYCFFWVKSRGIRKGERVIVPLGSTEQPADNPP